MAAQGELVGGFARDAIALRDAFGGESHSEIGVRIVIDEPGVGRNFVAAHGDHRHGFGASGNDDFRAAAHDAFGGHGDRLQAGGTEAIDGQRRNFDGQARAQRSDAGDVHPLLGFGHGAAEDDVFNLFRVELRHAVERALNGDGCEFIGTGSAERAFEGASDGRTHRRSNDDFTHENSQCSI